MNQFVVQWVGDTSVDILVDTSNVQPRVKGPWS